MESMNPLDKSFHQSVKPRWSYPEQLVYPSTATKLNISCKLAAQRIVDGKGDKIVLADLQSPPDVCADLQAKSFDSVMTTWLTKKQLFTANVGVQLDASEPELLHGIPGLRFSDKLKFEALSMGDDEYEKKVWEAASILFDDIDSHTLQGVPVEKSSEKKRARKEKFSEFLSKMVQPATLAQILEVRNLEYECEERAVIHLSAHNIVDACEELVKGKDGRLGTMVAQIGCTDDDFHHEMALQIIHWREQKTLAEFPEAVRAIYELLAGTSCACHGDPHAAAEDKCRTFNLSTRFSLDWRRAFGLRLWYSLTPEEPMENAVRLYFQDVKSGLEHVKPVPWFVEDQSIAWDDQHAQSREDPLWTLLKIYASTTENASFGDTHLDNLLAIENTSGHPFNARLSFQLAQLLSAKGIARFSSPAAADKLTLTYATQLASGHYFLPAVAVLLHLNNAHERAAAIEPLLTHNASLFYADPDTNPIFAQLAGRLALPTAWLHRARATYARAVLRDPAAEVACLLAAGEAEAAHAVLTARLAPAAVVGAALDPLREALGEFEAHGAGNAGLRRWRDGAAVYFDYIHLLDLERSAGRRGALVGGGKVRARQEEAGERRAVLGRLVEALPRMAERVRGVREAGLGGADELTLRVAVWEMSRFVSDVLEREQMENAAGVKGVPKSLRGSKGFRLVDDEDAQLKQTMDLSASFYRAIAV